MTSTSQWFTWHFSLKVPWYPNAQWNVALLIPSQLFLSIFNIIILSNVSSFKFQIRVSPSRSLRRCLQLTTLLCILCSAGPVTTLWQGFSHILLAPLLLVSSLNLNFSSLCLRAQCPMHHSEDYAPSLFLLFPLIARTSSQLLNNCPPSQVSSNVYCYWIVFTCANACNFKNQN